MKKNILDNKIMEYIYVFIEKYGTDGLKEALHNYESTHHTYVCKSKSIIRKIPIYSINYIEIFGHEIIIHTTNGNYSKYGTLKSEYGQLKKKGFVKCNQSILVPISKISEINGNWVTLSTGESFSLSRSCVAEVIHAYIHNSQ